jgi:hypothetical protein
MVGLWGGAVACRDDERGREPVASKFYNEAFSDMLCTHIPEGFFPRVNSGV